MLVVSMLILYLNLRLFPRREKLHCFLNCLFLSVPLFSSCGEAALDDMSGLRPFLKKLWFYKLNIAFPSITATLIYLDLSRTYRFKEQKKLEAAAQIAERY